MKKLKILSLIITFCLNSSIFCIAQNSKKAETTNKISTSKIETKTISGKKISYLPFTKLVNGVNKASINGNQFNITKNTEVVTTIVMNNKEVLYKAKTSNETGIKLCGSGICVCSGDDDCGALISSVCPEGNNCAACWCTGSGDATVCVCSVPKKVNGDKAKQAGGISNPPQSKKK